MTACYYNNSLTISLYLRIHSGVRFVSPLGYSNENHNQNQQLHESHESPCYQSKLLLLILQFWCNHTNQGDSTFQRKNLLHYCEDNDTVFCHTCVKAFKELKMSVWNAKDAFISRGFSNWKLATSVFQQQELSNCHKGTVEKIIALKEVLLVVCKVYLAYNYIYSHLILSIKNSIIVNKTWQFSAFSCVCALESISPTSAVVAGRVILSNLRFLARQACAIRGDGNKNNSNFI